MIEFEGKFVQTATYSKYRVFSNKSGYPTLKNINTDTSVVFQDKDKFLASILKIAPSESWVSETNNETSKIRNNILARIEYHQNMLKDETLHIVKQKFHKRSIEILQERL